MITKHQRNLFSFIRNYLTTVVSLGTLLALFIVMVCSMNVSSEGANIDDTSSPSTFDQYNHTIPDSTFHYDTDNKVVTVISKDTAKDVGPEKIDEPEIEEDTYYIELTDDEVYMLATLIYLEGNVESLDCQRAICSVVINRMNMWDMTLEEVIYQKNQFTPARLIKYYDPTDVQIGIVEEIMKHGVTIPEYVCYFRADRYHNWSGMNDFKYIDSTYFSFSDVDYGQYIKECNNEI